MQTHLFAAFVLAPLALSAPALAQTSVPDVSRLEYRAVTLPPQRERFGAQTTAMPTHLWIVPAKAGEPRIGLGWNGVPYETQNVGDPADWRADVAAFLEHKNLYSQNPAEFDGQSVARQMLTALGATDLQREVGAQIRLRGGGAGIYLQNLRDAGVRSFSSEHFSQTKLQLSRLLEIWPAQTPSGTSDLRLEARQILADIERRAQNAPRPDDEIAGLIHDLQNVRVYQFSVPGNLEWTADPTVQKLAEAGDAAVEPLLKTLETDDRLTLSVRAARFRPGPGSVGTVREAAQSALEVLLKHRYNPTNYRLPPAQSAADVAAQMRADWEKVKDQTPQERIFNDLNRPNQTPQHLLEAAQELVRTGSQFHLTRLPNGVMRFNPLMLDGPFWGEALRARQNPSVSDVLEARIIELSRRALSQKSGGQTLDPKAPDYVGGASPYVFNTAMEAANQLAAIYSRWDAARAAPLLGAQLERTQTYALKAPRGTEQSVARTLQDARRDFLTARLDSPFGAGALDEYGEFLASQPLGLVPSENYDPLWKFADEPAMIKAAHALFDAPRRPWQEAATRKSDGFNYDSAFRLLSSRLVANPTAKAAIVRELNNRTVVGTLRKSKPDEAELKVTAWSWSGPTVTLGEKKLENGDSQPLRVCDLVGFWLKQNRPVEAGQALYVPALDVTLPTATRDARLGQIAELVRQGRVVRGDDSG